MLTPLEILKIQIKLVKKEKLQIFSVIIAMLLMKTKVK